LIYDDIYDDLILYVVIGLLEYGGFWGLSVDDDGRGWG
jgi:hypothetical protein